MNKVSCELILFKNRLHNWLQSSFSSISLQAYSSSFQPLRPHLRMNYVSSYVATWETISLTLTLSLFSFFLNTSLLKSHFILPQTRSIPLNQGEYGTFLPTTILSFLASSRTSFAVWMAQLSQKTARRTRRLFSRKILRNFIMSHLSKNLGLVMKWNVPDFVLIPPNMAKR